MTATAPGASTLLEWTHDELVLTVADDGAPRVGSAPFAPGRGIRGMRERVEQAGGRFESGPAEAAGWRVTAVFPLAPAPSDD